MHHVLPDKVSVALAKRRAEIKQQEREAEAKAVADALDNSPAAILRKCLSNPRKIVGHDAPNWYR